MSLEAAIATTRLGLGAGPGDIEAVSRIGPRDWLLRQIEPGMRRAPEAGAVRPSSELLSIFLRRLQPGRDQGASAPALSDPEGLVAALRGVLRDEITARFRLGAETDAPFHERLTRFWSNHFTVAARNPQSGLVAGAFEREAIRPNILGDFATLAAAAVFHPAMLVYLDNAQSVGPNARAGRSGRRGLNENLAREILELHTVTPASGFSQGDVEEFARALTGHSVGNPRVASNQMGEAVFIPAMHEPGTRTVLGRRYAEGGEDQARAILRDLCQHPETAKAVSTKLARHLVADTAPPSLVEALTRTFLSTGGNLPSLYRTAIEASETWRPDQRKVKTPDELLTSAARFLGLEAVLAGAPRDVLESFAHRPFAAPSPRGWPDTAEAWLTPDALMKRVEWANRVAVELAGIDARALLTTGLGALVSEDTARAVARAESGTQALALALLSPEFQRR